MICLVIYLLVIIIAFIISCVDDNTENFVVSRWYPWYRNYGRRRHYYSYPYSYPWNYSYGWWGYPSRYDPRYSVPFYVDTNNCHRKCADKYDYKNVSKIRDCIREYCY